MTMFFRVKTIWIAMVAIHGFSSGEGSFAQEGSTASPKEAWKAGVAAVEITPEGPMWMSGYGGRTKPATKTESPLRAVALALEDPGGKRAVMVGLDLVGIDRATSVAICEAVMKQHGLAREQIVLNCSHTHCGPAVGRNLRGLLFLEDSDWKRIDDYTLKLRTRVVAVVGEAIGKLAPASLEWGEGSSDIAVNRRSNRHDEVVSLRAAGQLKGPSDHSLPVLRVADPGGDLRMIVFGYACHPTKLSGTFDRWCGDYAGFAQAEIEKAHPGALALFWQGCGGDQTPWPRGGDDVEEARKVGRELAEAVEERLRQPMKAIKGEFEAAYVELDLQLGPLPQRAELETALSGKNAFQARLARVVLERLDGGEGIRKAYPGYPVQIWRFGSDLQWIFLGGEVVVDYAMRFKDEFGPANTWIAGYSNDVMAYIPSERVLAEGGYEGGTSMVYYDLPTAWAPGIEEAIARAVGAQLGEIVSGDEAKGALK